MYWTTDSWTQAAILCVGAAAVCIAAGPAVIHALARAQCLQPERFEDCPSLQTLHAGKQGTPTMGGGLVLGAAALVAAMGGGLHSKAGWLIFAALFGFGALGLLDDSLKFTGPNARGLRTVPKLMATLAVAGLIGGGMYASGGRAGVIDLPGLRGGLGLGAAWVGFAALVMVGASHAVNLTDGMDGLAAGCLAIALAALCVRLLLSGSPDPALIAWSAALAGACLGFLWFNSFPAKIFMGDVGAMGLGAGLGALSLLAGFPCWLVLIGGVFVAEALSVIAQVVSYRYFGKRRLFRVAPLHHHFQVGGTAEPKLIMRFWLAGLGLALLGLSLRGNA